jgi:hypothetical protein
MGTPGSFIYQAFPIDSGLLLWFLGKGKEDANVRAICEVQLKDV